MPHIEEEGLTDEEIATAVAFLLLATAGRAPSSAIAKRALVDRLALLSSNRGRLLGQQLIDKSISITQFISGMQELITSSNVGAAILWAEGPSLTPTQQASILTRIKSELGFLDNFESQLKAGTNKVNTAARAAQYGQAVRPAYYDVVAGDVGAMGFDGERNVLHPADHCTSGTNCPGESARGVVPLGDLAPIGSRTCRSNCQCSIIYSNSATGATLNT